MRHSIEYKSSQYRRTIGFMKLDKSSYNLDLKILKCCMKHRPKITILYNDILKAIEKHFKIVDTNARIKKNNMLQPSRFRKTKLGGNKNEKKT